MSRLKFALLPLVLATLVASASAYGETPGELVQQFKGERSPTKRAGLARRIVKLGVKAESALLGSWRTAREPVALEIVRMIEGLGTKKARVDLLKATEGRNRALREAAVLALGRYPHPASEKALVRLLSDRDENVALAAIDTLGNYQSKTTLKPILTATRRYLQSEPEGKRLKRLLSALQGILKRTQDRGLVLHVCRTAAQLDDADRLRMLAVLDVGESKVCPPILRAVLAEYLLEGGAEGEDLEVEAEFGQALADSTAADNLRPVGAGFARIAILGLGRAHDTKAANLLLAALYDKSVVVRGSSLEVLHLTLPRGPRSLGETVPSDYPEIRKTAIRVVMSRLTDRSDMIRDRAHAFLKRETKQKRLPRSFVAWKKWYDGFFGDQEEDSE